MPGRAVGNSIAFPTGARRRGRRTGAKMADTDAPHREAYRLSFDVEKPLRYHQRRRRHFEWLHRLVMLAIILCGSAAFAGAADSPHWFGLAGAVLGALARRPGRHGMPTICCSLSRRPRPGGRSRLFKSCWNSWAATR